MRKPRSFLIAPVRGFAPQAWRLAVEKLEAEGWSVHWPARDTDQSDAIGVATCEANRAAMEAVDRVHVIWDGVSQGCLFDLGMAFALKKPVTVIEAPEKTAGKSFQNVLRALDRAPQYIRSTGHFSGRKIHRLREDGRVSVCGRCKASLGTIVYAIQPHDSCCFNCFREAHPERQG